MRRAKPNAERTYAASDTDKAVSAQLCSAESFLTRPLRRPGGYGEGAPPDPIPNSAVKPLSADGTAS